MMIVMKEGATQAEIAAVVKRVESVGAHAHLSRGELVTVIGAIGDREHVANLGLEGAPGVDHLVPILKPYKLASLQYRRGQRTVVDVDGRKIGGDHFATIAGPCTVESREVLLSAARTVRDAGAQMLRGGAYKPRTSPYSFQGLGEAGLRLLAEAKEETGLPIVTELMDVRDLDAVVEVADVVQLGARNMQNYSLLTEVGRAGKPVLLKRGLSATLEELLMAAEYVLKEGNPNVLLCERGIRTYEPSYRFTLDLMAVPVLRELTHLPIVIDPSHAAGKRSLVEPLSLAAAAAGADGVLVETHPCPEEAVCDGPQAFTRTTSRPTCASSRRRPSWPARPSSGSDQALKVAVLGVGLIGGSIGLAARELVEGAEVVGFGRDSRKLERARELGAIDTAAASLPEAVEGADLCFACAPVGALPGQVRAALDAAGPDTVVTDVGSTKGDLLRGRGRRPLRGRAPDRGRRDGGSRARARGPLPGCALVPHAARALPGAALRAPTPLRHRRRSAARGSGSGHPRPAGGGVQSPAPRSGQPARLPGRRAAVRARRRAAPRGAELPRHDPGGRAPTQRCGATSTCPIARPSSRRSARSARSSRRSQRLESGEGVADWNDRAREDRRELLEADVPGRAGPRAAAHRSEPPRYRRPGGTRARAGGR